MRRARVGLALVGTAVLTGATSGCATTITSTRLERALAPTVSNLYVRQQSLLGIDGLRAADLSATARCQRGNSSSPDRGAGEDWVCVVQWVTPGAQLTQASFDLRVKTDGCYVAEGAPAVVGQPDLYTPEGRRRVNPLSQFDGCLPIS